LPGISPDWTVELREEIDDLLPGRTVVVTQVSADRFALRVRYEIHPAVGSIEPEQAAAVSWLLHATDDTGHAYLDGGGAFGASPDGGHTEGVRSLQPAPSDDARVVELEFTSPEHIDDPVRVLRVSLPRLESRRPS
jgi:hypothetical protein